MRKTRVRFAPSPTGPLHMGGVRTALYNYLFAKQRGGTFILRIEDTDSQRFVSGAEEYILESLKWCGITPDEGVENGKIVETPNHNHPHAPYRQSQRKEIYKKYAIQLINSGDAYYSFDTSEELDIKRKECESRGETFIYNSSTRGALKNSLTLDKTETEKLLEETDHWVIRFKVPENAKITITDQIRGEIDIDTNTLDDKVIWKCIDKLPTYHLANVVDDKYMEITDVIRGEEWLPSLPLHFLLYRALGWEDIRPKFAHLSLLLKPDGKGKLSKRDGDRLGFPVFPLEWKSESGEISKGYREDGYYPEAFVNILALLGWNPGTEQEILSLEELVAQFSLERVVKSGAKFNLEKAKWFNQEYLRKRDSDELTKEFKVILERKGVSKDDCFITKVIELIKERASFVNEFWDLSHYFFEAPKSYDQKVIDKFWKEDIPNNISQICSILENTNDYSSENIEKIISTTIKDFGWKMGPMMNSLRVLLVGESKGPSIAEIISLIGKDQTIMRIKRGLEAI
jgi:glutamyl-tRNA synthetase